MKKVKFSLTRYSKKTLTDLLAMVKSITKTYTQKTKCMKIVLGFAINE